ncbi:MAG: DASS family sodium-coupled anion symporter [Bryobacteraceae bacterium]
MWRGLGLLLLVYLFVVYVIPKPESVKPEGWRLAGIFAATIVGSVTQPMPGGALVLLAITISAATGVLKIGEALAGYADPSVWLVIAAFIIARALIDTGLARRIALQFVRMFGKSSLGVSYALGLSDMVLAGMIPSNGARSGGVIMPIARSIAELYGSAPGATASLLGCFLMTAVYQSICVTAAMFYTGQASNPLAAQMARGFGVEVTWASWFFAGLVPGLCSLAVVPWVVMKMNPPVIRHTPEAAAFASRLLNEMGPMKKKERILTVVFAFVAGLWITSGTRYGMDITVTALLGSVVLIATGVLTWEDVKTERAGWDIFVWYGGFLRLGKALNEAGVTKAFAEQVGQSFESLGWVGLFAVALVIYFYAHYGFASISAHLISMFPPFLAVLLAKGAPAGLMVYAFACFANLSSGLTNYGTTPSPIFFAQNYVSMGQWWKIGFVVSIVNLVIWSTVGFAWWHILGIW